MTLGIERYRQRLLAKLQELEEQLGREIEVAREATDDQPASSDRAHLDELKEEYFAMADTDSAILKQVVAALIRIENGTFGRCVVDEEPIEEKRLDAVPWTPYCVKHQQELEDSAGIRTPSL
jgi:DnaK suppressor protein